MADPDPRVAKVAGVFDALAPVYDASGVEFFQPIARSLLDAVGLRSGDRVLDVGCGRGAVLFPAADLVGPSGSCVGIDISEAMVADVRRRLEREGRRNVDALVGDAVDPSFAPGSFDVLVSSLVLFFLPDPPAALANWLTLLSPGSRLGVTTFGPQDPRWAVVDEVFAPYLPADMRDARTTGAAGPFASDAGMAELVEGAGFTRVRTVLDCVAVRFTDTDQWRDFSWSTGQRAMWLAVPEAERPAVRAAAEERLAGFAAPDGSITFDQRIRHTVAERPA